MSVINVFEMNEYDRLAKYIQYDKYIQTGWEW